jgi:D-beta-D-heptose 7-phosphate kinase / D-beta-D-heptose 1-phosphate adenosyltransferase
MDKISNRTIELIENLWENQKVLVVGDVILDKYIWGKVERISPEAPVPVVHGSHSSHRPGGAANVAMNIATLGGNATIVGFVGGDEDATILRETLRAAGVGVGLVSVPDFPTISKLRILSGSQQMLRLDFEKLGNRPEVAYEELIRQARGAIPTCSAVVLSDYAKGTLSDHVCKAIIQEARALGIPVLVDPKSSTFEKYRNATTVCPNLRELILAAHQSTEDLGKLFDICERLVEEYEFDFLTVTLAEKGIAVVSKDMRKLAPAVAKQVFDVSGAGDTVIATLSLCLASGIDIEIAIELANVAAGVAISKVGTVPVERSELIGALSQDVALRSEEKIVTQGQICSRVATWRASGQQIVFTNGCFDLLHVGHINLLERARQQGNRLIVAINSDDSVRKLKGDGRPIVSEQERARVLAALAVVDAVVTFNESTPLDLIRSLRPHVLVKGGDYTENEVVGAEEVRSWGGRICLVPFVVGFSTSKLIAEAIVRVAS